MPIFDDYINVAERRKAENRRRLIQRITMTASISVAVALLGAVAAFAIVTLTERHNVTKAGGHFVSELSNSNRMITSVCSLVLYRSACVTSITDSIGGARSSGDAKPKDVIRAVIKAALNEQQQAAQLLESLSANDAMHQAALSDCKELIGYAIDELRGTLSRVVDHDVARLSDIAADLRNWLSGVLSYQDTCLDGLMNEALKAKMQQGMTNATQLTSNALAIVTQFSSILSLFQIAPATKALRDHRRLMSDKAQNAFHGIPEWVAKADRRFLKDAGKGTYVRPDAVVAKDGSGNYTTVGAALVGMPKKRSRRYVIYVKAGVYDEAVTVTKDMINVMIYGDGSRKTIVTGKKNFVDGTPTFRTATFGKCWPESLFEAKHPSTCSSKRLWSR